MFPLGISWSFDVVGSNIKLSNARTTATVFDTKMDPPRQLCQQQILPECVKFVRCSVMDAQDARGPNLYQSRSGTLHKKLHTFHDSKTPLRASIKIGRAHV